MFKVIDGRRTIRTDSIKEFVRLVDDLNLNLSIIGTYRENSEEDGEDSVLSVKWRMPLNVSIQYTVCPNFIAIWCQNFSKKSTWHLCVYYTSSLKNIIHRQRENSSLTYLKYSS